MPKESGPKNSNPSFTTEELLREFENLNKRAEDLQENTDFKMKDIKLRSVVRQKNLLRAELEKLGVELPPESPQDHGEDQGDDGTEDY